MCKIYTNVLCDSGERCLSVTCLFQVKELETDNANMRQFGKEKQNQVVMLEQKVSSLESVVSEMTGRAKDLAGDNARVASERDSLADNVKKLTRDMKRLGDTLPRGSRVLGR